MLGAIGHGKTGLCLKPGGHSAVAMHMRITPVIGLEQIGRHEAAAVVALAAIGGDRHGHDLSDGKLLSALRGVGPEFEAGSGDFHARPLPDRGLRVRQHYFIL